MSGELAVVDEPKLRFEVEVREGDRVIGTGTHERPVVDGRLQAA